MITTTTRNGFQLYKDYISRGEVAPRYTAEWRYSQLLTQAFYVVGITRLFDLLEQAELSGQRVDLVYEHQGESGLVVAHDISLVDRQPFSSSATESIRLSYLVSQATY